VLTEYLAPSPRVLIIVAIFDQIFGLHHLTRVISLGVVYVLISGLKTDEV
jgi:hypothetical protein